MSPYAVPQCHLHIGGQRLTHGSGGVHAHRFPATGEVQSEIPLAGVAEVDAAVQAAHEALRTWTKLGPAGRRDALTRLADLMARDTDELARLSVLDNAMTFSFAQYAAGSATEWTRYYAGFADKVEGRVVSTPGQLRDLAYTVPEPYGVIGIIITWNGPLISLGMKVIPALAAGNTVVIKPSELTPYMVEHFLALVAEAGIPAGVVNLVPGGPAAGEALVRHRLVQKVSFTGGPATARKILTACAADLKPAVVELGGKSANLIFPDANLDAALWLAVYTSLVTLAGQGCAMPTRLLVHDEVYDEVADRVTAAASAITLGDPFDPATESSPLVTAEAQQRVLGMIERAVSEGAGEVLTGGGVPEGLGEGYFVSPTVIGEVDPASEIAQVEVFGPVLSLIRFSDEAQAIDIANSTSYGLAAYAWTNDLARVNRLTSRLRAGGVYVNGGQPVLAPELPFGGLGVSGYGREGGAEGLYEFVRTKAVSIARG